MTLGLAILIVAFISLLLLEVPVAFVVGIATVVGVTTAVAIGIVVCVVCVTVCVIVGGVITVMCRCRLCCMLVLYVSVLLS